ncbi:RNA polymerase sigma factor [Flavobacterium muglaense]|uniref:RNA polymerase sigma factor n=1 Tax=Flavobacterium muglaense TaxID=2764716 RepID=A0A923SGV9_9FLAO|nr:RNA polymerase sigma factor [Flavobacterium muglaense]MBC5839580.1 RNA polymerase sigma factor [Flavobacterium muglaense]MBC5846116.1 RNA polymerase sigma factor [Flavobacterium muglaense]
MNQLQFIAATTPFKDKLFRLAKRLLVSTEEAEDATQEVLVKLWCKNEGLNKFASLEAFAMTIAKNYCLDQLRLKRTTNQRLEHDNYVDQLPAVDKIIEDKDSLDWVDRVINHLPDQQRIIIQMRDVEQYEFDEIAQIMDMNETAIRVALSRARKTIRQNMIKINNYGME